jgi:hypothetical protein
MNDLTQLGEYLSHYPSLVIVLTTALIFLLGTIAQILSDKTSLPAIIFLLLFGSLLGKQGLNWINPDVYSSVGIRAIIAVAVAIVVFEGGLMIDFNHLRHHLVSVLGLITLNVLITILAMAWVTSQLLGIEWRIAFGDLCSDEIAIHRGFATLVEGLKLTSHPASAGSGENRASPRGASGPGSSYR